MKIYIALSQDAWMARKHQLYAQKEMQHAVQALERAKRRLIAAEERLERAKCLFQTQNNV